MKPYYQQNDRVQIYCGDCIKVMAAMPENSVDAVVTDPPYGLEFMGKEWDKLGNVGQISHGGISDGKFKGFKIPKGFYGSCNLKCLKCERWKWDYPQRKCTCEIPQWPNVAARQGELMQLFHQQWATEALRVLKPGGHALVAGIGRTHHRTMCGMEDAGFEIRDCVLHLFGSGFPKSTDISKQIDKMAGAEREVVGVGAADCEYLRRGEPCHGHGDAGKRQSGATIHVPATTPSTEAAKLWDGYGTALKPACEIWILARKPISEKNIALNCLKWGVGALSIDDCMIGTDSSRRMCGTTEKSGETSFVLGAREETYTTKGRFPANVVLDEEAAAMLDEQSGELSSGARDNRNNKKPNSPTGWKGTNVGGVYSTSVGGASRFFYVAKPSKAERGTGNTHATVKPIKLMEYLIRLITREGQTVLDPFGGSMTTVLAAVGIGRKCIAIEKDESYCEILRGRCRQMVMGLTDV